MKNQYFGDIRDLFKYDLIQYIVTESKIIERCLWVSMLTPNDDSGHGEVRHNPRAGFCNRDLQTFLMDYHERKENRDIRHLRRLNFFRKNLDIYPNEEFAHTSRGDYFKKIPNVPLKDRLIFFDPDTGTDIGIKNTSIRGKEDRYIFGYEINDIVTRMETGAVLMIYQHHRREKNETKEIFLNKISVWLKRNNPVKPLLYISDGQIAFFFLTKDPDLQKELSMILRQYAEQYDLFVKK